MKRLDKFNFVTEQATKPEKNWTNKDIAQFHYFNPNGLCARKFANDKKISDLVSQGLVPSGWSLAYGVFDSYYNDAIQKLAMSGRVNSIDLQVTIEIFEKSISNVSEKISSITANVN